MEGLRRHNSFYRRRDPRAWTCIKNRRISALTVGTESPEHGSISVTIEEVDMTRIIKTDDEWRNELSEEAYAVLRRAATEPAFTGKYTYNHDDGLYRCGGCGAELFSSNAKFDSGSGWPSFTEPANVTNIDLKDDDSHGMHRIEVNCAVCGGHLGHVFDDGPGPNGKRFCINSCALDFDAQV